MARHDPARQTASNQINAQKSTGPRTAAGKEASAANAYKHGVTAAKYLGPGEDPDEFHALYAFRRALHPPNDPVIDDLVLKITLILRRLNRAFGAEAEMLKSSSLDQLIVEYRAPVKNLNSYEATNRKLLQTLRDELAAYEKALVQRPAMASPVDGTATRSNPPPHAAPPAAISTKTESNAPPKAEPVGTPPTLHNSATPASSRSTVATKEVAGSRDTGPATPQPAATPSDASAAAAAGASAQQPNPKTKPNSMENCRPTVAPVPTPAPAARSPVAPAASPAPKPVAEPPLQPKYQMNFDLPGGDTGRR